MLADDNAVTRFFPSEEAPLPKQDKQETTEQDIDSRARQFIGRAVKIPGEEEPDSDDEGSPLDGPIYEAFRSVEDLTNTARALYEAAGTSSQIACQTPKEFY